MSAPNNQLVLEKGEKDVPMPNYLGVGAFETMRFRRHIGRIPALNRHVARALRAAEELSLVAPELGEFEKTLDSVIAQRAIAPSQDLLVRLILQRDSWLISIEPWTPRFNADTGIAVVTVEGERPFPHLKSSSALVSVNAASVARGRGADEALLISRDGFMTEGAWSNVFWVDEAGSLITPASGMLPGITRGAVIELMRGSCDIQERNERFEKVIHEAFEMFITHATHGVVPICLVNDKPLNVGPLTREAQRLYEDWILS